MTEEQRLKWMELTDEQVSSLAMYSVETYSINLNYEIGQQLITLGLVSWIPPIFGTRMYVITEEGKQARNYRAALKERLRKY